MGLFDWFKKQPKKDVLELKKDAKYGSVYASLSKLDGKNISHEEAQVIQAEIMELLNNKETNSAVNYACRLLTKGHYEACITAFENIMAKAPSKKGTCENQIGAACFFLNKYPEAIEHYLLALEYNFDLEMLDYNVWEAAEAQHKATGDNSYAKTYLERFPAGEARDAAMKLL